MMTPGDSPSGRLGRTGGIFSAENPKARRKIWRISNTRKDKYRASMQDTTRDDATANGPSMVVNDEGEQILSSQPSSNIFSLPSSEMAIFTAGSKPSSSPSTNAKTTWTSPGSGC
ncbi:hypothetical protein P152DRAFT_293144 [Eremomyces bilateralis CBS 781.70]|uniref:Uncharacterized protein n=1 Tax=Eremomyces bilateralis CBS 781.70 TaxID=1392243 RepID=A0A6G1G705_9PEZI|nr:uncharacterized protein P152DRAFT_293144 [Eremomyces bilateralis CBS 781.70]KAF1813828.1 hypothetical protein P152DRAFT_293144 [Eremomyces bilateralis CBS 781.70]